MSIIQVNGIKYEVDHNEHNSIETIALWDMEGTLIADAEVNHNFEEMAITMHNGSTELTFNYFNYTGPTELAQWIVAVMD